MNERAMLPGFPRVALSHPERVPARRCAPERGSFPSQKIRRDELGSPRLRFLESGLPSAVQGVLRSRGRPLDASTRAIFEPLFGHDFSRVRVHDDAQAAESARAVNARAYTVGHEVVFGAGAYAPLVSVGRRLLAHELTHVLQQEARRASCSPGSPYSNPESESLEAEANSFAERGWTAGCRALGAPLTAPSLQRKPAGTGEAESRQASQAEFEADQRRFQTEQEAYFVAIGTIMREQMLTAAGFGPSHRLTTPEEALQIARMWGVTLDRLLAQLPQVTQSLSGQVTGSKAASTWAQQQESLRLSLTPRGQSTLQQVLQRVRAEPFWRGHMDRTTIYIFPDISGGNRYGGYVQRGKESTSGGPQTPAFVIHLSRDALDAGETAEVAATLVHELAHTLYEPAVLQRSMKPFLRSLAELLADHPRVVALRGGQSDERQAQVVRIHQILYESTGYGEAEIVSHLVQLTHQPPRLVHGETFRGSDMIAGEVEYWVRQIRRIGLPPRMVTGILRSVARRVEYIYDRRVAAAPMGSTQRRLLEVSKRLALAILEDAIAQEAGLEPVGE